MAILKEAGKVAWKVAKVGGYVLLVLLPWIWPDDEDEAQEPESEE